MTPRLPVGLPLFLGMVVSLGGWAVAAEPAPSEDRIRAWVGQLGDENYDARERAEAALSKAGPAAIPFLTKAVADGDAEVKTRAQRALDELKWAAVPDVSDLAAVLPADTMLLVQAPRLKEAVARLRAETPLGKLYDLPALAALKATLGEFAAQELSLDDQAKQTALTWLNRYGGYCAATRIRGSVRQAGGQEPSQEALVLGVNDSGPGRAFSDFAARFPPGYSGAPLKWERYRGIEYLSRNHQFTEALARVKNLIARASSPTVLKCILDGIAGPNEGSLARSPAYTEALAKVGPDQLATLFFNFAVFRKTALSPKELAMASASGADELRYCVVALGIKDGLCAEQAFFRVAGERKGLAKLLSFKKCTAKWTGLCPPDALLFATIPFDARAIYETILTMTEVTDARGTAQFKASLTQLEEQAKVKVVEQVLSAFQGEAALWVTKPSGPNPAQPPELFAVFETRDAAAATGASEALAKLIVGPAGGPARTGSTDYKGRKCFWVNQEAISKDLPYTFSWCADGARVLVASGQEGLQRLIGRAEANAAALDQSPDFQRLLALTPVEDRGGLVYLNTAAAASWGYTVGLPLLTAAAPEELKGALADAPKDPQALFADFPGTLFAVAETPDGIRTRAVGGVPVINIGPVSRLSVFLFDRQIYMLEVRARVKAQAEAARREAEAAAQQAWADRQKALEVEKQQADAEKQKALEAEKAAKQEKR